jgi:hypothetical protein
MRIALIFVLFIIAECSASLAKEYVYQGTWTTTNRKLDGQMTCIVMPVAKDQWRGRFYGIWQGVPLDYRVTFTGPANELRGTATIDGVAYQWKG